MPFPQESLRHQAPLPSRASNSCSSSSEESISAQPPSNRGEHSSESAASGDDPDEQSEDVELSDNGEIWSEEHSLLGSSTQKFVNDRCSEGGDEAISHAARYRVLEEEESEAQTRHLAKYVSCLRPPPEAAGDSPTEAASGEGAETRGLFSSNLQVKTVDEESVDSLPQSFAPPG